MHVKAVQRHVPGHTYATFVPEAIDHRHAVAGVALAHAAGPGRPTKQGPHACHCVCCAAPRGVRALLGAARRGGVRFHVHGTIAHDVVDLGLAEHLVDRDAELALAIVEHGVAHRLARAHDGLQLQVELLAHRGGRTARVRFHHRLKGGRE